MLRKRSRTYHDPLHGAIALDRHEPVEQLLIRLIDTPAFQRLRRVRQLGAASLTFHGAESSRFTHALGVMELTRKAFDLLAKRYPKLAPHRATVLCAALLHDIGHGPFSHTAEDIFNTHHEYWTQRIIRESPEVQTLITQHDSSLTASIESVYVHQHPVPLVWQLVSSQLDCDRLDYLMRDSYFTGASYGNLDLDRIVRSMDIDHDTNLVVSRKGQTAVEHYLLVRYFMYAQVYNHPKNLAATWILTKAFQQAQKCFALGDLETDRTMQAWLNHPQLTLTLDDYLAADDIVFTYHLQRWQHHSDPLLSDLCQRFIHRNLLKGRDVSNWDEGDRNDLLARTRTQVFEAGYDPDIYCGLSQSQSRGYTLYQRGIKIWVGDRPVDIKQLSPLIAPLTHTYHRTWLLHPAEVTPWLDEQLK
ncbi:HD domain-containing protein [Oscillatoria sp. CS-180]|uniref:HD domain-containing protein n=1 Tax=Oscillatoria sp. CS-180 TaxID=3021720 RepID=UPI00232DCEC5|nr:HD domain-containing protein [Oscillatoria sp. CS-180]MDB9529819.1 HD domain-containing protein [Oscillatoria sp. CS-180]